jgi:hypothetical protein
MPEAKQQALMEKILEEIVSIKHELSDIKSALVRYSEPDPVERNVLQVMEGEITEGSYRPWKEIKKELENDE